MTRRLLLLGINYEPEPTGTALPTTWWSESISELGWGVDVVTGIPHYPAWRPAPVEPRRYHGPIRVSHRRHYVPRRQSAVHRGVYEATWVASALPELRRGRYDAVLGVVPALGGALLAAAASHRHRAPFALVFQDLMGRAADLSGMPGARSVAGPVRTVELALARRAAGIAIIAEGFRDYFVAGGVDPARIHRVRNPARISPINVPREVMRKQLRWGDGDFVVLHSGSIGYKQGLETVVAAAELARADRTLRFAFQGDGNQRDELEARVAAARLQNVEFLPLARDDEFGSILAAADALLLNQRGSILNMSLPAKLATYFAAGVPVIAAVAEDDETAGELRRAEAGILVRPDDPRALLAGVGELRRDHARARSLGQSGARFAATHLDAGSVVSLVDSFLDSVFPTPAHEAVSGGVG
jgi:colanic acid biosynthesis glycosyl transferase WcaI